MRVGETLTFCLRHVCVKHQRPPSDDGSESRVLLECRAVAGIPPWPELAFLSRIIGKTRGAASPAFCLVVVFLCFFFRFSVRERAKENRIEAACRRVVFAVG